MTTREVTLALPDQLVREAEANGLLKPEALEGLLRAELRRRMGESFTAADQPEPPPTDASGSAVAVREQWMRLMGMAEEEIRESCEPCNGPFDLDEELKELAAAREFASSRLSYEELTRLTREGGSLNHQP